MRSLKIQRKPRGQSRAKTMRHAARSAREASKVQPGAARRRKPPGIIRRAFGRLATFLGRPMLALTAGFCSWL